MKKAFSKLDKDLLNIESITVGINLDSNLNPKEAGLLKINSEVYKSGDLMDKICTHFALGNTTAAHSIGRLEDECQRISTMLNTVTVDTLLLMDEAFSSTSAKDGLELAESTIYKMREIGCKCIFSTHIHELSERVDIINTQNISLPKLDKLAVLIKNGERTYKIRRGVAEGTSDAKTIAHKYGLI